MNYNIKKLFVLLVLIFPYPYPFSTLTIDSYKTVPELLKPGQEGIIQITLKNPPPSSTSSASAIYDISAYFNDLNGIVYTTQSPVFAGTLDSGGSIIITAGFKVSPTSKGGIISAPFYITQKDSSYRQNVVIQ